MSGAAAGGNSTAKLQEDKKAEVDPAKTSQQPSQPNTLEEDDEFEDFPVEGELPTQNYSGSLRQMQAVLTYCALSRLDTGGSRGTWRQHTSVGGELG
jgi:hypothetical protein